MDPSPIFTIDTPSTITCLLAANHYLPHHTFNPLLQQTGELYKHTDSLGKSLSLCCADLRVASNTCMMFLSSYWFDNLGFLLREDLLLCCFTPCSWGSQRSAPTSTQRCIMHPTPLNQNLCHLCPPYLPISIIAIPIKFSSFIYPSN